MEKYQAVFNRGREDFFEGRCLVFRTAGRLVFDSDEGRFGIPAEVAALPEFYIAGQEFAKNQMDREAMMTNPPKTYRGTKEGDFGSRF
jgi:hypothetical protein